MLNKEFEKIWKFHQWSDKRDSCLRHVSTCLWINASWMLDRRWINIDYFICLLYTSPSPRDKRQSRMPSSAWKKKAVFERADWLYLSRRNGAGIHQSRVCLPSLKKRMGSSLSCRFLEHARNWRNLIGWFRGWKLKNTDFSRKIKTPDWCIYHTGIEMENFFPISLSPWSGWTPLRCFFLQTALLEKKI